MGGRSWVEWLILVASAVLLWRLTVILYRRYFHPLRDIPGPAAASITNLWYFNSTLQCISDNLTISLHDRYGKYVRVAPNCIQTSDPDSLEDIYSTRANFSKSEFYALFNPRISHRTDMFCETDEKLHTRRRRDVAGIYAPGAILGYEHGVAGLVNIFCQRIDNEADPFDISTLCRRFTFDVIGEMFYGKDGGFGFMRDGIDYNSWMSMLDRMMPVGASMSFLPNWARTPFALVGMLSADTRQAFKGFGKVVQDAQAAVKQRVDDSNSSDKGQASRNDVLSKLLQIVEDRGDKIDFHIRDVETEIWMMIYSGADTSAYAFAAIFYYILKAPDVLKKLQKELDDAFASGRLSYPVKYSDAVKLPYLNACITDAVRLHPPVGLMLPRVVPKGGATVAGRHYPEGTIIGIQASAMHRDKDVFGEDAHNFVPERWIRDGPERAQWMERKMLMWGAGSHTCIGKQVSPLRFLTYLQC